MCGVELRNCPLLIPAAYSNKEWVENLVKFLNEKQAL